MTEISESPRPWQKLRLAKASVRLISEEGDLQRWNELIERFHYLGSSKIPGKALRYVVEVGEEWVALLCFSSAALHLKAREEHIGWASWQRRQRLGLLANNSRFLVLPSQRSLPNLASKSLSLALKRLPGDWLERFGTQPVAVETFVDEKLYSGTCYKAANWTVIGSSKGFKRHAAQFYQYHGNPKMILIYPLIKDFRELLRGETLPEPYRSWNEPQRLNNPRLPGGKAIGSLMEGLGEIEDKRERKGQRYFLASLLAAVVCGYFAGCRSLEQCAAFVAALDQRQRRTLRFWRDPKTGKLQAPSHVTLWRAVCGVDAKAFDSIVAQWLAAQAPGNPEAICIDGKVLKATGTQPKEQALSVSAISHDPKDFFFDSLCVSSKGREPQAVVDLLEKIGPVDGTLVTMDALHCRKKLASLIVLENGGDYLMTVKGNSPILHRSIGEELEKASTRTASSVEKGHGRIESRSIEVAAAASIARDWPHAAQIGRITRVRENVKSGKKQSESVLFVTSQAAAKADPAKLLKQSRGHWMIENALHYRKDVTLDEDRCHARKWSTITVLSTIRSLVTVVLGRLKKSMPCIQKTLCANPFKSIALLTKPLKTALAALS